MWVLVTILNTIIIVILFLVVVGQAVNNTKLLKRIQILERESIDTLRFLVSSSRVQNKTQHTSLVNQGLTHTSAYKELVKERKALEVLAEEVERKVHNFKSIHEKDNAV